MKVLSWETRYGSLETYSHFPKNCVFLKQVHGMDLLDVKSCSRKVSNQAPPEADGFICESPRAPKSAFAIQTADCIPALLEGDKGWALLHLGWKGLALKMVQNPRIQNLELTHLWIGPHISGACYEVSQEFTKNFPSSDNFHQAQDKLYFDLQKELIDQVRSFAPGVSIQKSSLCTFHHQGLHSFRANGTKQRNWTILTSKTS